MTPPILKNITLDGFKSIRHMIPPLDLRPLNVLIGPNGAGKSNLVSFFRLLEAMRDGRLQEHIAESGGADSLLFGGSKLTPYMKMRWAASSGAATIEYAAKLIHTPTDRLIFSAESIQSGAGQATEAPIDILGPSQRESCLSQITAPRDFPQAADLAAILKRLRAFHFHDTSARSGVRLPHYLHDNVQLCHDAANLAPMLYRFQEAEPLAFRRIVETFRQIAPWVRNFELKPLELDKNKVLLNWRQDSSPMLFGAHQMSDGALRALALVTLLLQPRENLPALIVIDEPELGLHPYAMVVVASLARAAAHHCQIILATQSPFLLDQFDVEDVVVVEQEQNESVFRRLEPDKLAEWVEEYSLSELWEKNVIGGGPA